MGTRPQLPGVSTADRIICHVDMDCFYAACERLREPALVGEPVVVGMGFAPGESGGAVATASYEAREYGVESAQPISEALEKLPPKRRAATEPELSVTDAGFYRPVDMEFYKSVASDIKEILHATADVVREVSIDEAYLDVTSRTEWDTAESFGNELKESIGSAVDVTASVGIAPSMSTAKIASDHDKPDGLVVVGPGTVESFLAPLDIADLHGIGPVTAGELRDMGIDTAGDLAAADPTRIEERFGERGRQVCHFARGQDDRPVEPRGKPKSLSRESAFGESTSDRSRHRERVRELAHSVSSRAGKRNVLYQTIGIKVVTPPFDVNTRDKSLPGPVNDGELLKSVALEMLEEFDESRVRKLGVRVSNLSFTEEEQASLGEWPSVDGSEGNRQHHLEESNRSHARSRPKTRRSGQLTLATFTADDRD